MTCSYDPVRGYSDLSARIEDLRYLLRLESRSLRNQRLDVKSSIILRELREIYPGAARRIRDELLMGTSDHEELLLFCLQNEDPEGPTCACHGHALEFCRGAAEDSVCGF